MLERRDPSSQMTNPTIQSTYNNTEEYLNLLKKCLTYQLWNAKDGNAFEFQLSKPFISLAQILLKMRNFFKPSSYVQREYGMDWPSMAYTMIGMERLNNVEFCVKRILQDKIDGDLIETGVWRGGCTIFMRAILKCFGETQRSVWVADSFAGMPKPNKKMYPADKKFDLSMWRTLAISVEEVRENFRKFDLLDDQVKFLHGWFSETLSTPNIKKLALIRLDGDLYESTIDAITQLYPKLSDGGFLIVDDYHCSAACRKAIDFYRQEKNITDEMIPIDWSAIYWRKNGNKNG
jgi:hypothetical protein